MTHLWDVKHDYYCNQGNYFAPGGQQPTSSHATLDSFLAAEDDADLDYNLLFRWDMQPLTVETEEGDENEVPGKYRLLLFFMGQRKGLYRWVTVTCTAEDEPRIRTYLEVRWAHLCRLWRPIDEGTP